MTLLESSKLKINSVDIIDFFVFQNVTSLA